MKLVEIDLNNNQFQKVFLELQKNDLISLMNTLRKISKMTWEQVYTDNGLNWEKISSRDEEENLYSFRIGKGFRGTGYRAGNILRIISLHPDHDSAYD